MTDLQAQRVLIVGGARDIGLAVAEAVSRSGGVPVIGARSLQKAEAAVARVRGAEAVQIDITDEPSIEDALRKAGQLNHIVVTTSAHHNVPLAELDRKKTTAAFDAKVIGPLLLAKHARRVLASDGSIVLISGVAAWNPSPSYAVMGIANGAVAFTATHLAKEMAPIRVNAISPGIVDSGSWDHMGDAKSDFLAQSAAGTLVGRTGSNADIAEAILWLLGAGFVSGETIHVDGGARFE